MSFTTPPDAPAPHLDVNSDTGNFVYAVAQRAPGGHYMAEGTTCSWTDFMKTWGKVTGQRASYQQVSLQRMIDNSPDKAFGREIGDMYSYTGDPGYDGGKKLISAADMRKVSHLLTQKPMKCAETVQEGIDCPMTSLEEYCRKEDWARALSQ